MTTSTKVLRSAADLEQLRSSILDQRDPDRISIVTSVGTCGLARGSGEVAQSISEAVEDLDESSSVDVRVTGCHGFCQIEPVVVIYPERVLYQRVSPEDVAEIVAESVIKKKGTLTQKQLDRIRAQVEEEIQRAVEIAKESRYPPAHLLQKVTFSGDDS